MAQVPKELIDEAAKRGIVPGAIVAWKGADSFVVPDHSLWHLISDNCIAWMQDGNAPHGYCYLINNGRWATVITPAPAKEEEGLKEGDACECGPAMRAAIKELAKELGLEYTQCHDGAGYIGMAISKNGTIVHAGRIQEQDTTHTPEAFIAKMRVTAAKPKPIRITSGGKEYTVHFNSGGAITVGCTVIDFATMEAIYNKAKATKQ